MDLVYKRQDVEIAHDVDRNIKLVENINFKYAVEFNDDLITIQNVEVILN